MSMADDNSLRTYRSNDPYRRGSAAADEDARSQPSDPLAELARLIGQSDPFSGFARNNAGTPDTREPPRVAPPSNVFDRRSNTVAPQTIPRAKLAALDAHLSLPDTGYPGRDPHQMVSGGDRLDEAELDYSRGHHEASAPLGAPTWQHEPPHGTPPPHDEHIPTQPYGQENAAFLDDGEVMGPHDHEIYDDAPPSRWRKGATTAISIMACAVLGTAGAYAYRTYSMGARATQAPPVITAEKTPTKVVPVSDQQSSKTIQDRVRDQGANERVVSREEQPVELRNMITTAPPPVVFQGAASPSFPQASMPGVPTVPATVGSLQPAVASPTPGANEPKRVRTVTIRPDGTDLSGRPVNSLGPSAGLAPASSTRGAPSARAAAAPPSTRSGEPISLDPQGQASEPPSAARERPPAAAPPPTRVAAAPANGTGGGYFVQLSSQKSDADAQASIRSLQAKYPHLLNGQSMAVRRADLGAKGVYYRAVAGPFASSGEADSFCSGLKAAGGQCLIQRN